MKWLFVISLLSVLLSLGATELRIDCGGKNDFGFLGGRVGGSSTGAAEDSERWGMRGYRLPVEPGFYQVKLGFAERHFQAPRQRVFDLSINGRLVVEALDLFARFGNRTATLSFPVDARDGVIEIGFQPLLDQPSIREIVVTPIAEFQENIDDKSSLMKQLSWGEKELQAIATLPFRLRLPFADGKYRVRLQFEKAAPGAQVFDLVANGRPAAFDVNPAAGTVREFVTEVTDHELLIQINRRFGELPELRSVEVNPVAANTSVTVPALDAIALNSAQSELLEEISVGCFRYFWHEAHPATGLVKDRSDADYSSVAATGFGLAAMVVGAERGYLPRQQIEARVLTILRTLAKSERKNGMFYHYLDFDGKPSRRGYENVTSTVDTALLLAGAITAGEYFGGEIRSLARELTAAADWRFYTDPSRQAISMGWRPDSPALPQGKGRLLDYDWNYYSDETILCTLLAIAAPEPEHRLTPDYFYRWRREQRHYRDSGDFVYSWSGAAFTYQFAHLFIDFEALGKDCPADHGMPQVPAVNWFENSRNAMLASQLYSADLGLPPNFWGQTACNGPEGYLVAGFPPRGDRAALNSGTVIAPYGAGSAILFWPEKSLAALEAYRQVPGVWQESSVRGEYGFRDSFMLNGFVDDAYVGIDQGPLLLAIENFRSGLIRRNFTASPEIRDAIRRIGFEQSR